MRRKSSLAVTTSRQWSGDRRSRICPAAYASAPRLRDTPPWASSPASSASSVDSNMRTDKVGAAGARPLRWHRAATAANSCPALSSSLLSHVSATLAKRTSFSARSV
ncbi:hypothetical protein G6F65_023206 [Rhizopus arrhizus]|nr:hypothetical protein G6F31_021051 [Rhizopus arrhizus]KAG1242054.1 hypothetical protein G6F65_023206 [Rhizopus arrhizus]